MVATINRLAQRLDGIQVSPIERIKARGSALASEGRNVIDLSAGEPNFKTPDNIQEAAVAAMKQGETRYTAVDGTAEIKSAIIAKFQRENGLLFEIEEVIACAGAKQVIFNALAATVDPGQEIVLPAPYFALYPSMIGVVGGKPVIVRCTEETDFKLRPDTLERALTSKTRWVFLNSPSNPSGATYTADELRTLADVLLKYPQVYVLSDDIYEHILFDEQTFSTIAQIEPRLRNQTLTVNGASKAYSMTGWRIGYGGGPRDLIGAMAAMQSQSTSCPCSISQAAAIEALNGQQNTVIERRAIFQDRRDVVVERLNSVPGIHCTKPKGAFYVFPSCNDIIGLSSISGNRINNDVDFAMYLLAEEALTVVPGEAFGSPNHFRISFATSTENLEEGCDRIARACAGLS